MTATNRSPFPELMALPEATPLTAEVLRSLLQGMLVMDDGSVGLLPVVELARPEQEAGLHAHFGLQTDLAGCVLKFLP